MNPDEKRRDATPWPAEGTVEVTECRSLLGGLPSVALAIAEDDYGEQVICWGDTYCFSDDMVVTLVEDKNKVLHRVKRFLNYAPAEVARLWEAYMPIFKVDRKWVAAE